jgi:hypothetical protein
MRVGVGGSAFGVRGGISTRGIGGGFGPLSAGTPWRRSRRSRGSSAGGLGVVLLVLALWPYWLGTYVAVKLGSANPSMQRSVIGWIFEVAWLIVLAEAIIRKFIKHRRAKKELASVGITTARRGNSAVYRHGACPVNHRTPRAAARCRNL